MRFAGIRLGFANNSSSSHSILVGAPNRFAPSAGGFAFGWESFHLVDREDKLRYVAVMAADSLQCSDGVKVDIVREICGRLPDPKNMYVDHGSVLRLPAAAGHAGPGYAYTVDLDVEFAKEFAEYVARRDDVTIAGGNDNDGGFHPGGEELELAPGLRFARDSERVSHLSRRDGDWWTLFNVETGALVRLSFKDVPAPYVGSATPELVDLKITDKCMTGCPFCYMGSTPKGEHADAGRVENLFSAFAEARVFEVAIGGGEPTRHPEFVRILWSARKLGVVPNFTAFDMSFADVPVVAKAVAESAGSFAVSSLSPETVEAIGDWNTQYGRPAGTLQIPLGCYPMEKVVAAVRAAWTASVPVTLLGYKRVGRGAARPPYDYSGILEALEALHLEMRVSEPWCCLRFGADSLFVKEFGRDLSRIGVSEQLTVRGEGLFSAYVDAVAGTFGPSSFCGAAEMRTLPEDLGRLWDGFPFGKVGG